MQKFYDFYATNIEGTKQSMSQYKGKVVLVVNVASRCAFTPQYKALQSLYEKYNKQGLEILGFPCNQFKEQESGTDEEIQTFCHLNYGVTFSLFSKVDVNGSEEHPLFLFLKQEAKGFLGTESIKWNFTKFLIDRDGNVIGRYSPMFKPEMIDDNIVNLLNEFVVNNIEKN